jgi:hypothetical protein
VRLVILAVNKALNIPFLAPAPVQFFVAPYRSSLTDCWSRTRSFTNMPPWRVPPITRNHPRRPRLLRLARKSDSFTLNAVVVRMDETLGRGCARDRAG